MKIVAIAGQKGGVGKTTAAMSLAAVLAESDMRVLLVDIDAQQSATWWAARAGEGLPFDFATEKDPSILARMRKAPYDAVVVDTPGSHDDESTLATVLDESDYAVLPAEPVALSIQPLLSTVTRLIRPRDLNYRVLLNKVDSRRGEKVVTDMRDLLRAKGMPVFATPVRMLTAHAQAPLDGTVVTGYGTDRGSRGAAEDYRKVALQMVGEW